MSECVHLTAADIRRVPWRNGRGTTEELRLMPPGAEFARGDFDWRLARAAVVEPGPFSAFPGFDRVLVVVEGAGLVLDHGDVAPPAAVHPLQPHRFAGEWPTWARLADGPVADLNLLLRRDAVRGELVVARPGPDPEGFPFAAGEDLLVHALSGTLRVRVDPGPGVPRATAPAGAGCWRLAVRESLHLRKTAGAGRLDLHAEGASCVAVLVRVAPVSQGPAARC